MDVLSLKCMTGNWSGGLWVRPQKDIWVWVAHVGGIFTHMAVKAEDHMVLPRDGVLKPERKGMRTGSEAAQSLVVHVSSVIIICLTDMKDANELIKVPKLC